MTPDEIRKARELADEAVAHDARARQQGLHDEWSPSTLRLAFAVTALAADLATVTAERDRLRGWLRDLLAHERGMAVGVAGNLRILMRAIAAQLAAEEAPDGPA